MIWVNMGKILDKLHEKCIVKFYLNNERTQYEYADCEGGVLVVEQRDQYNETYLSKEELKELIEELKELVERI